MSTDQAVEVTNSSSGDNKLPPLNGSGSTTPSQRSPSTVRSPPSLGQAFYNTLRQSFSGRNFGDNNHANKAGHDLFVDVGDGEEEEDEVVQVIAHPHTPSNVNFEYGMVQHGRLPLHDIAEENPG